MKLVCKSNRIINIRPLEITDSEKIYTYFKKINDEKTFIRFQGEKITLEDEIKFVETSVKDGKENKKISLVAEYKDQIIASCDIIKGILVQHHIGTVGLIVAKKYRGEGIGKMLLQQVIKEAKTKWKDLKIIRLDVFANNKIAIQLYNSIGFEACGILPKGLYYRHRLVDEINMFKKVR